MVLSSQQMRVYFKEVGQAFLQYEMKAKNDMVEIRHLSNINYLYNQDAIKRPLSEAGGRF